jgi:hypothetical protein
MSEFIAAHLLLVIIVAAVVVGLLILAYYSIVIVTGSEMAVMERRWFGKKMDVRDGIKRNVFFPGVKTPGYHRSVL